MTFWIGLAALTCGGIALGASKDDFDTPWTAIALTVVGIALLIGSHYA